MPVRDTSIEALEKHDFGPTAQAVFDCLDDSGPTHDRRILEYLQQKDLQLPRDDRFKWEINKITGRRNFLVNLGVIIDLGKYKGTWQRKSKTYHLWALKHDRRPVPPGWILCQTDRPPVKPILPPPAGTWPAPIDRIQVDQEKASTRPVPSPTFPAAGRQKQPAISTSMAGATLAAARHRKKIRRNKKGQGLLF